MAGTYIEGQSKILSGVYSLIKAIVTSVESGQLGVVAVPFTANWGPVNKLEPLAGQTDMDTVFNAAKPAAGLSANKVRKLAWAGKPSKLLGYRMATMLAAPATATLPTGWELETVHPTDRAFTAVVKAGLTAGTTALQVVEAGVLLVNVEDSTVDGLAAKINASGIVKVTSSGVSLPTNTAGVSFAGGNNGAVVTSTEYSSFLTEVEADLTANGLVLDGVVDEAILTVVETWLKRVRDEGFYLDWTRGGTSSWDSDLDLANTKSKALNYRGIINVGNGVDGYTSADMAVFVSCYHNGMALNRQVTDMVVPFESVNVKTPLTKGNRIKAKESGTLIFVMEGGKVVIDEGVNTLTVATGEEHKGMGKIRVSRTIDTITRDLEAFGQEYKKTKSNTEAARQVYASLVEDTYFRPLVRLEVIQPGYSYKQDPDYHGKASVFNPKLDEAFFYSEYQAVDGMEKIYQKFGVKF